MTTSQLNMVAQATSETSFIPNTPQTTDMSNITLAL